MSPSRRALSLLALAVWLAAGAALARPPKPGEGAPRTIEEVEPHLVACGNAPNCVLELWFSGLLMYGNPSTRPLATYILAHTTADFGGDLTWPQRPSSKTFVGRLADPLFAHVFRSYFRGTAPENGYLMPPDTMSLVIEDSSPDPNVKGEAADWHWRIRLRSSGADAPRIVYLVKNPQSGRWQVTRFSSVYVDIRPPVRPVKVAPSP